MRSREDTASVLAVALHRIERQKMSAALVKATIDDVVAHDEDTKRLRNGCGVSKEYNKARLLNQEGKMKGGER